MAEHELKQPDDEPPGGPFRSWGALYATVIVWAVGLILFLWVLTVTLQVDTATP